MKIKNLLRRRVHVAVAVLLLVTGAAHAQVQSGNLFGTVVDNEGQPLPGVTLSLSGIGAPKVQVTNAEGQFRFLSLSPGRYAMKAALEGFSTVEYTNVDIAIGRNTTYEVTLSPAVEEVITVTAESPLLDRRRISTGTTVTQVELEKIPTARDPWSILNQTPGVLVDRINVGGNESGQQSNFMGPGTARQQNSFAVDGVTITDMAALGASPTYYDFEAFGQVHITTGGTDASKAAPGVGINIVTKRGTNEWRGSTRFYLTDGGWQASGNVSPGELGQGLGGNAPQAAVSGNRVVRVTEAGFELGGPILKDRLWIWGAYSDYDIDQEVLQENNSTPLRDDTDLRGSNLKFNAQLQSPNSLVASYQLGDKLKFGRNASPTRPAPTTWNQDGPTEIWKLEDTHVFNSQFFLTGLYSFVDGGFALTPQGGLDTDNTQDASGVFGGSYLDFSSNRDVDQWRLDGSYFFNSGSTSHEIKFGGGLREAQTQSATVWPGSGVRHRQGELFGIAGVAEDNGFDPEFAEIGDVTRPGNAAFSSEYTELFVQDTVTWGNFTANVGLHYDQQSGQNDASSILGSPFDPDLLPAVTFGGNDAGGFEWEDVSPRLGITYALGRERKTLLRGSFAQFADQLGQGLIERLNPVGVSNARFLWHDLNQDGLMDASEPRVLLTTNFDPANPFVAIDQNDPNLQAPITQELIVAGEHALLPEFVVGASFTYRTIDDLLDNAPFLDDENGVRRLRTPSDYEQGPLSGVLPAGSSLPTLPDGTVVDPLVFYCRSGLSCTTSADLLVNGQRSREYTGIDLTFNKRLANRWMLRGFLNFSDSEWDVPNRFFEDPNNELGSDDDDGGTFAQQSAGSGAKAGIFVNSGWSLNVNGMYQIAPQQPWAFNVAANISAREGFPLPYFQTFTLPDRVGRDLQLTTDVDQFRNEDILTLDLRFDKDVSLGDYGFNFSIDMFNLFNEGYVIQREPEIGTRRADFVNEVLSPRIIRASVRLWIR